jgi:predicted metal-dependent hydrolase
MPLPDALPERESGGSEPSAATTEKPAPVPATFGKLDPALANFHARDLHFGLTAERVTDWCGDPWRSLFFNALSITFPAGERFFIGAVAHYRDRLTDPKQRAEVAAFVTQEALHTREHIAYNEALSTIADVAAMETILEDHIENVLKKRVPPLGQLAVTCGLEHFTAIIAKEALENPSVFEGADPAFTRLWTWHALEECEHKAVTFDVFQTVTEGKRNWLRVRLMVLVTMNFVRRNAQFMYLLMKAQGLNRSPLAYAKLLWSIFGSPGPMRRIIPAYLKYYNPRFHPNDIDDSKIVNDTRRLVDSWV